MKPNHHSLAYKMQAKPNKTYKDLKQKQKKKIAEWMFQSVCEYYKKYGVVPGEEAFPNIRKGYSETLLAYVIRNF